MRAWVGWSSWQEGGGQKWFLNGLVLVQWDDQLPLLKGVSRSEFVREENKTKKQILVKARKRRVYSVEIKNVGLKKKNRIQGWSNKAKISDGIRKSVDKKISSV